MTGFGRATASDDTINVSVDLSSVNKKGLEISASLPKGWQAMERGIFALVRECFSRGKVSVSCKVSFKDEGANFSINEEAIFSALEQMKSVCERVGAEFSPDAELILKLNSYAESPDLDCEIFTSTLEDALKCAIEKNMRMREDEGEQLKADFTERLALLRGMIEEIEEFSKDSVPRYREALLQRLKNAGLESINLDDERVLKELALFADKCDICEEITRLKSHIEQFKNALNSEDSIGRKLDFICQEMMREINTISSKANNLQLTKISIEFKNELERVREQVQNVE